MIRYDLHTHSTSSDGDLSPSELVSAAAEQNVVVIALTDHDTVSGCGEAAEEAEKRGIGFVPGIEISCSELDKLHILGLGVDYSNAELIGEMSKCADSRRQRTYRICEALAEMGANVDAEKINSSVRGNVGKPHIARELINNGYAESVRDAFAKYLTDPRIEDIKKYELGYAEAVALIHKAGGLAVLAHPYQMKLTDAGLDSFAGKLKECGLDGIECWYSAFTPEMTKQYLALADKYDLLVSLGSDYHGVTVKPDIHLAEGISGSIIKQRELFPFECARCILNSLEIRK